MTSGRLQHVLKSRGFLPFLVTQFLGALNDNIYKLILTLLAVDMAAHTVADGIQAVAVVGGVFVLPFLLFSGYAGYAADVFSKHRVLRLTKSLEIIAMSLACVAFLTHRFDLMLGVLFIMAMQSAFFSPAKYGILPEMVPDRDLSRANGLLEMSTFVAIIMGGALGGMLLHVFKGRQVMIGGILLFLAILGTLCSFGIRRVPPSGSRKPFRFNPWFEVAAGLKTLFRIKTLGLTVLGITFFWFMGAVFQMSIIVMGKEVMGLDDRSASLLFPFLAIGIGVGSLGAGRLSGDKVEPGLVPLGSLGMGIFSIFLALSTASFVQTAVALVLLGASAGLFIVPLNALLQQQAGHEERGRLIAANNFLNFIAILLASGAVFLGGHMHLASHEIILIVGSMSFVVTLYILLRVPDVTIRFVMWLLTHSVYHLRIRGQHHVPLRGPALLVCNRVAPDDALLVGSCLQRFICFVVDRPSYKLRALHWFFKLMNTIPLAAGEGKDTTDSLDRARKALQQGHAVGIFLEESNNQAGTMLRFRKQFERVIQGMDVPVIPIALHRPGDGLVKLREGRFAWNWPRRILLPVTVSFGEPLSLFAKPHEVR